MTAVTTLLLGLLVFASTASLDFAHTRYVQAVADRARDRAAMWSVLQWMSATVAFVVAVKVSLWVLPFEALGLFVGTWLAVGKSPQEIPEARVVPRRVGFKK